MINPNTLY